MVYDQTRAQFGKSVDAYNHSPLFQQGADLEWLLQAAMPTPEETALDIGTATGATALTLAPHLRSVVGIDVTPEMIGVARQNGQKRGLENTVFEVANAEELPYPDASFAIVACRYTAHHFHNPNRAVREAARVLRPGGRLLVIDNTAPDDAALDRWINEIEKLRDPSHVKQWSGSEWQALFTGAGLTFETVRAWSLPLDFADWVARQQVPPQDVATLRRLFAEAGPAERSTFHITEGDFALPTRLMRGFKR